MLVLSQPKFVGRTLFKNRLIVFGSFLRDLRAERLDLVGQLQPQRVCLGDERVFALRVAAFQVGLLLVHPGSKLGLLTLAFTLELRTSQFTLAGDRFPLALELSGRDLGAVSHLVCGRVCVNGQSFRLCLRLSDECPRLRLGGFELSSGFAR